MASDTSPAAGRFGQSPGVCESRPDRRGRRLRLHALCWLVVFLGGVLPLTSLGADPFDLLEGKELLRLVSEERAPLHLESQITGRRIASRPRALRGVDGNLLLIKTDQGNVAKILASPAFRKQPKEGAKPVPILVLERFETLDSEHALERVARGKELLMYQGFQVDLDSGCVVPPEQGGDLVFLTDGGEGRLQPLGAARLFTVDGLIDLTTAPQSSVTPGRVVRSADFSGRYRLVGNGQWFGRLDLEASEEGIVKGLFHSDLNGAVYPLEGRVGGPAPQQIKFSIRFPRSQQDFEGHLWTEGKTAITGTMTVVGRPYGFVAWRDGMVFPPRFDDGLKITPSPLAEQSPPPLTILIKSADVVEIEGREVKPHEVGEAIKRKLAEEDRSVQISATAETRFDLLRSLTEAVRQAGARSVELAPLKSSTP